MQLTYTPVAVNGGDVIPQDRFPDFLDDLARVVEGVVTSMFVLDKWRICATFDWPSIEKNQVLQRMVRLRRHERKIDGSAARELARVNYPEAVGEVSKIISDKTAPPRAKIDGARELRQMTGFDDVSDRNSPEKFTLTIIVGDTKTEIGGRPAWNEPPGPHNLRPSPATGQRPALGSSPVIEADDTVAAATLPSLRQRPGRTTLRQAQEDRSIELEEQLNSSDEAFSFPSD